MAMTMHVDIVSAESEIFSGAVTECYAPASQGEVGIFPHHAPMLTTLGPGEVRVVDQSGESQSFFVSSGILEVQPHVVTILSDTAMRAADIDEAAALEAKARAEAALQDHAADMDYARAQADLAQAAALVETIKKVKRRS